jgi:hypothetical protein
MSDTLTSYTNILTNCREVFLNKTKDYGTAWRILRPVALADQLYIKAHRIRTIQETGESKVGDGVEGEFMAIINYCIIALIQIKDTEDLGLDLPLELATTLYDKYKDEATSLMLKKNHDYGEAWRDMRVESLTDLILMKILRIKQIDNNKGATLISEGVDGNYFDMLNYAVFALILLDVKYLLGKFFSSGMLLFLKKKKS